MYKFWQSVYPTKHFSIVLVALFLISSLSVSNGTEITIASWGGAHTRALEHAYFQPYTEVTGVTISSHRYSGGLKQLRKQVQGDSVIWDAVDMTAADVDRACQEGLLETLPLDQFVDAPGETSIEDDFFPGGLAPCAVAYGVWSTVFVYEETRFPDRKPTSIRDLFDLQTFPGKRGLRRSPRGILEWALVADGVERDSIYAALETDEGLTRALDKLQTIKSEIVWWENPGEIESLLVSKEVTMGAAYSTAMFDAIVRRQRPLQIIWDAQLMNVNYFAVPKGSYRFTSAWQFIRFASDFDRMPMLADYVAYGPARRSSHSRINTEYLPYLPTTEENFEQGFQQDGVWWAKNQQRINLRFVKWLSNPSDTVQ